MRTRLAGKRTSKRAQKQEEENGDYVQEIDKAERAVAQQVRRPYGMGGDAEAGKEGVLSTPLPEVAPEVVGEVKGGGNKADTVVRDGQLAHLDAVKKERVVEAKVEISAMARRAVRYRPGIGGST